MHLKGHGTQQDKAQDTGAPFTAVNRSADELMKNMPVRMGVSLCHWDPEPRAMFLWADLACKLHVVCTCWTCVVQTLINIVCLICSMIVWAHVRGGYASEFMWSQRGRGRQGTCGPVLFCREEGSSERLKLWTNKKEGGKLHLLSSAAWIR